MKKILCPTDFSSASYNAITYAAKLAQLMGAELTLLNVQSLYDIIPVEFVTGNQFTLKATAEKLQAQCREVSKVFRIACNAEAEPTYHKLSTVISGKAGQYDLLVMGSNGVDDLYQFFLGTNTYNALIKTKTAALMIPEGHLYSEIKQIVYAFDYLRERRLPFLPLLKFARPLKAEITVLQVMEEAHSKKADADLHELQFILQSQAGGYPVKYETIRSNEVPKGIDGFISQTQPDILALCSLHRSFIENFFHKSVIRNISAISTYPVFVFPE